MNQPPPFSVQGKAPLVGGGRKVVDMVTLYIPGPPAAVRQPDTEDDPNSGPIVGVIPGPGPALLVVRCKDDTLWIVDLSNPQAGWAQLPGPPPEEANFQGDPRGR